VVITPNSVFEAEVTEAGADGDPVGAGDATAAAEHLRDAGQLGAGGRSQRHDVLAGVIDRQRRRGVRGHQGEGGDEKGGGSHDEGSGSGPPL